MTSMRRHYVASTSVRRRHVPAGNLAPLAHLEPTQYSKPLLNIYLGPLLVSLWLTLKAPVTTAARQRIHMKNHALFSSKDISKILKCSLLQFLFGALRVNRIGIARLVLFTTFIYPYQPNASYPEKKQKKKKKKRKKKSNSYALISVWKASNICDSVSCDKLSKTRRQL